MAISGRTNGKLLLVVKKKNKKWLTIVKKNEITKQQKTVTVSQQMKLKLVTNKKWLSIVQRNETLTKYSPKNVEFFKKLSFNKIIRFNYNKKNIINVLNSSKLICYTKNVIYFEIPLNL